MAQLLEYLKMAVDNIRANKGRSILTMLGIIIGISSVIMIMSIGQGAKGDWRSAECRCRRSDIHQRRLWRQ